MAQEAYFRIEHKSFNREDWGYGRVAAHARYAANENKRGYEVGINVPEFRTSYQTEAYFKQLEKLSTRKNARLGDTLIVSFPTDVSRPHRLIMMERFLGRITFGGQTIARAWEHTDKPHNPHFHVVLIDRHHETGKSVGKFGHSRSYRKKLGLEPNVTEWMRKQWEDTGNELFNEFGYSLTFDRRSNLARGLDEPALHRGPENDNAPAETVKEEAVEEATQEADATDDPPELEEDARVATEDAESAPANAIRFIHSQVAHLEYLQRSQEKLHLAQARYEWLVTEREKAAQAAGDYYESSLKTLMENQMAQERLAQHQRDDGRLKGRSFGLFGRTLFKTGARKEAEKAQAVAYATGLEANAVVYRREAYDREVTRLSDQASQAERDAYTLQRELTHVLGDQKDMAEAEQLIIKGTRHVSKVVTLADAYEAYDAGTVTEDEFRTYLQEGGFSEELKMLDDELQQRHSGQRL